MQLFDISDNQRLPPGRRTFSHSASCSSLLFTGVLVHLKTERCESKQAKYFATFPLRFTPKSAGAIAPFHSVPI